MAILLKSVDVSRLWPIGRFREMGPPTLTTTKTAAEIAIAGAILTGAFAALSKSEIAAWVVHDLFAACVDVVTRVRQEFHWQPVEKGGEWHVLAESPTKLALGVKAMRAVSRWVRTSGFARLGTATVDGLARCRNGK